MDSAPTQAVLQALASLQAKVLQLEKDRDHYALECEKCSQRHKEELRDVEIVAQREREEARRRQQDLRDAIQRATEERARLQRTLDERKLHHGAAARELEVSREDERQILEEEHHEAAVRASALRRTMDNDTKTAESLRAQLEIVRREREVCEAANERLIQTITDMRTLPSPKPHKAYTSAPQQTRHRGAYEDPTQAWTQKRSAFKGISGSSPTHPPRPSSRSSASPRAATTTTTPHRKTPTTTITAAPHGTDGPLLDILLQQLSDENRDLMTQYRLLLAQGRDPHLVSAPEALTETLDALVRSMGRKADQIRQIQQWKANQ